MNNPLSFDWQGLREPERYYVALRLREEQRIMASLTLGVALAFHVAALSVEHAIVEAEVFLPLTILHVTFSAVLGVLFLIRKRWPDVLRFGCWILAIVQIVAFAAVARSGIVAANAIYPVTAATMLGLGLFPLMLCPVGGVLTVVLALVGIGAAAYMGRGIESGAAFAAASVVTSIVGVLVQRVRTVANNENARLSMGTRMLVAPLAIASRTNDDLESAFRPARRDVACVSIKWRDVGWGDATEGSIAAMEAHFALCEELLASSVTDGAYFCDALAEEMFVIIFSHGTAPEVERPVEAAFRFARRLVAARAGVGAGRLDVGVAEGQAVVGIMGPHGHRKTTGLGEVPGRAARLQAAGLVLCRTIGDVDRVILDAGTAASLGLDASGLKSFTLGRGATLRDLGEGPLFYWEVPDAAPVEREAAA